MTFICIIFIERSCRSHAVSMYCVSVARCPTNTHFLCILSMHANFVLVRIDSEIYSVLLRWLVFCVFFLASNTVIGWCVLFSVATNWRYRLCALWLENLLCICILSFLSQFSLFLVSFSIVSASVHTFDVLYTVLFRLWIATPLTTTRTVVLRRDCVRNVFRNGETHITIVCIYTRHIHICSIYQQRQLKLQ